jgi:hypothetical protein
MYAEVDILQPKCVDQRAEVPDAVVETQEAVGSVGEPHAEMIGHDNAAATADQLGREVAPEEAPRGIAMDK